MLMAEMNDMLWRDVQGRKLRVAGKDSGPIHPSVTPIAGLTLRQCIAFHKIALLQYDGGFYSQPKDVPYWEQQGKDAGTMTNVGIWRYGLFLNSKRDEWIKPRPYNLSYVPKYWGYAEDKGKFYGELYIYTEMFDDYNINRISNSYLSRYGDNKRPDQLGFEPERWISRLEKYYIKKYGKGFFN